MMEEPFDLAPHLELHLSWGPRMHRAMYNRYGNTIGNANAVPAHLREEYDDWDQLLVDCCEVVKLYFLLTGGLPVLGDTLHPGGKYRLNYPAVRVGKRELYASAEADGLVLMYELESEEMEALEASWESPDSGLIDDGK